MTSAMQQEMTTETAFTRGITVRTHHVCVSCRKRRALFLYRGVVKADADHTLCFKCFRALRDRMRKCGAGL
jgi:hypothetical protein